MPISPSMFVFVSLSHTGRQGEIVHRGIFAGFFAAFFLQFFFDCVDVTTGLLLHFSVAGGNVELNAAFDNKLVVVGGALDPPHGTTQSVADGDCLKIGVAWHGI